jgi:prepilin-type N-terminal cleavage/methylation domain-containing protein
MRRRAFTLLELVSVVVIIGVTTALAVPMIRNFQRRLDASEAIAQLQAARLALLKTYSDTETWPAATTARVVPPAIIGRLPAGELKFEGNGWYIDYNTFNLPSSWTGGATGTTQPFIYLMIYTSNAQLFQQIRRLSGNDIQPWGSTYGYMPVFGIY